MTVRNYENVLRELMIGGEKGKYLLDILSSELSLPNIKMPTMGGEIFWTDYVSVGGWRLQQNDFTKHARILDENDYRIAWGTMSAMYRVMDRLVVESRKYDQSDSSSEDKKDLGG